MAGIQIVFVHDLVQKDEPWLCAAELATSISKETVVDTGSGAEDSDEMDTKFRELTEHREKQDAKLLGNPFLAMLNRHSKGSSGLGKKKLRKSDSACSTASSGSAIRSIKAQQKRRIVLHRLRRRGRVLQKKDWDL